VRQHRQIGPRGEYTIHFLSLFGNQDIDYSKLAHSKAETMSLKLQTEAWISEVSPGVRLDLTVYPDMDIINLRYNFAYGGQVSNSYRSTNVGFGITYTLPVIVALLSAKPGGLVLLENPEAHLHPLGQVKIAELIARAASCGIQVMVETHSDHILNGIRVAVHDGIISPELVKIYFLGRGEYQPQGTISVISPRIDRDGRIDRWPEGFFDEWDKSLERLLTPAKNKEG
jgi:predicted ATPase